MVNKTWLVVEESVPALVLSAGKLLPSLFHTVRSRIYSREIFGGERPFFRPLGISKNTLHRSVQRGGCETAGGSHEGHRIDAGRKEQETTHYSGTNHPHFGYFSFAGVVCYVLSSVLMSTK